MLARPIKVITCLIGSASLLSPILNLGIFIFLLDAFLSSVHSMLSVVRSNDFLQTIGYSFKVSLQ